MLAASGRATAVVPLRRRSKLFTDRVYIISSVGDYGVACYHIRTANDDKNTPASDVQYTLTLSSPATVYLDFWGGNAHAQMGFDE